VPVVVGLLGDAFPSLSKDPQHIIDVLSEEETQFRRTLVSCETVLHQPYLRNTASCLCSLHILHQLARSFSLLLHSIKVFPRFVHSLVLCTPFILVCPRPILPRCPASSASIDVHFLPSTPPPANSSLGAPNSPLLMMSSPQTRGARLFDMQATNAVEGKIPGYVAWQLWGTYGFPVDLTSEYACALRARLAGLR